MCMLSHQQAALRVKLRQLSHQGLLQRPVGLVDPSIYLYLSFSAGNLLSLHVLLSLLRRSGAAVPARKLNLA